MNRLTDRQTAIRDMTRDFVRKEVAPFAAQWDRDAAVPLDTLRRIGALGLFGVCIPEEWGGAGADFIAYTLATEELAYGDAGICNMVSASNSYGFKLRDFGTPAQKEQYLRPVASGRELGCMLLTEPQAGSDAANLRTRAERHGDRYVINGSKSLITSGRSARYAVVLAVTEAQAGKRGISAFVTRTDAPGYKVLRVEHKLGHRTNDTCQVALEDLEVPAENLLGERGRGLKVALSGLDSGRIGVAAQSIGVARAAFDAAFAYARGREAFGKRLTEHQAIAFKLAEMATEIEAARQMCRNAAALKEERARCIKEASMAKLFASQMCERVCSAAIQIHGGYGFINDYPVEKFYRDARVFQIYDGTNEVQKILIFRELEAGH
ncbi:MAG TPA: acyl-CoA dehydrogenase family protein [Candidatus Binataceae bacterium]|nr:acyl-CoA dehydrogenase family protein [Candidatus Binataceae bacterium]